MMNCQAAKALIVAQPSGKGASPCRDAVAYGQATQHDAIGKPFFAKI